MVSETMFVYKPLDVSKSEIRVLNVYPGDQVDDLILTLDVIQIKDDSESDFEAISYRWGVPDGMHHVSLDGQSFVVTSSQLRMIRDLRDGQKVRRLWIDALSINQNDKAELNHQVQLMRKVYSSARAVCIWLDYEIHETSAAYQKFLKFDPNCEPQQNSKEGWEQYQNCEPSPVDQQLPKFDSDRAAEHILEEEDFFWDPICSALNSEYFNRLWVQQEMSNARLIQVQCRRTPLPTACILQFVNAWDRIQYETIMGRFKLKRKDMISKAPVMRLQKVLSGKDNTLWDDKLDLLGVLHHSNTLKVTDERDMVYGIMCLAYDWEEGDLVVDYSKTVSEVFKDAMISYLNTRGSVAFLEHTNFSYHGFGNSQDENPSWVPNWRKQCHCSGRSVSEVKGRGGGEGPPVAHISSNFLITTGIKIGKVLRFYPNFLGTVLGSSSEHHGWLNASVSTFFETFNNIITDSHFPEDPASRLSHLVRLLTESGAVNKHSSDDTINVVSDAFRRMSDLCLNAPADSLFADPNFTLGRLRYWSLEITKEREDLDWFYTIYFALFDMGILQFTGLQPFVSQQGSIGLAPPSTQPGDEIWLIPTCKSPIVLRPSQEKFVVLGKACLGKEDPWRILGHVREYLTEGEEIAGYKVEAICLQ